MTERKIDRKTNALLRPPPIAHDASPRALRFALRPRFARAPLFESQS
jgi:hypothetical protein